MKSQILWRDFNCPNGGVFYSCNSGYIGCCLVEACNPGVGCPADQEATSIKSSSLQASIPTAIMLPSRTVASSASLPIPTSSEPSSSASIHSSILPSISASLKVQSTASGSTALAGPGTDHASSSSGSVPTAAVVGTVLGGVILVAMILGIFLCLRYQKRTKIYKGAVYPSSCVTMEVSPQLPGYQEPQTSRFAGLMGTKQTFAHHIDSRELVPTAEMGETIPRHILHAELPASDTRIRDV